MTTRAVFRRAAVRGAAFRWVGFAMAGMTLATAAGQQAQCAGTWAQVDSGGRGVRYDGAMVYDSLRNQYILFGGFDGVQIMGATEIFNPATRQWSEVTTSPSTPQGRLYHSMVYDKARDRVVLFGGYDGGILNDTWEFDPGEKEWKQRFIPGSPHGRFLAAMAYDSARGVTVLHGGTIGVGGDRQNNETWEWDGVAWTMRTTDGPEPRASHAMAYDSVRRVSVLYGGNTSTDTWEWDGNVWTRRAASGTVPGSARYHAMTFDTARGVTVLTAKEADPAEPMAVYEWDGSRWRLAASDGPASRFLVQAVYDQARARTVMFGGYTYGGVYFDDMWEWAGPSGGDVLQFIQQPAAARVCQGGSAAFEVQVAGFAPIQYQWRRNGSPLAGQTSSRLVIASVGTSQLGRYTCQVSNACGSITSMEAVLSICDIDLNCDGLVDFGDILEFLRLYDSSDPRVDFNRDGFVDFADYLECLNLYQVGC